MGDSRATLVDAITELTMRGGKRLRPAVVYAAHSAVTGRDDIDAVIDVGASLELLQTYLLIHDDWMDEDSERRGGPTVHVALAREVGNAHLGNSLAILAGDLASTYAWDLLVQGARAAGRLDETIDAFRQMQEEVVLGQELDIRASLAVERMQDLKTGSYTVRGPLQIGALLGGADSDLIASLMKFGQPLGVAFQLRDDLLGTFGDPKATGKGRGGDLRKGRQNAIMLEAHRSLSRSQRSVLDRVFGRADATTDELEVATQMLIDSGVQARVEARLATLFHEAELALADPRLKEPGTSRLRELSVLIAQRDR
ncbi:MAG: polyprenyl synthetase family protein [Sandaracinaceae bacterium]|nr:polyprenyl synthetase family protein [Sandaracinaceae bacterium]